MSFIEELDTEKFIPQNHAVTKEEIESQTRRVRIDLLKPKNLEAKVEYQLYFYFTYGNADEFIRLYSTHQELKLFLTQLKAATIYATLNQKEEAQKVLVKYFEVTKNYRPLEPFLRSQLTSIIDEEFAKRMLIQLKQASGD